MIAAIVLAAGESRRMGQPKLLMLIDGKPVLHHVINALAVAPIDEVVVVVGRYVEEVLAVVIDHPVGVVENRDYAQGMLSSVRAGLRALSSSPEAVLVAPGDQPAIESMWVERLVASFRRVGGGIHVPSYRGRRGHPMLFDGTYIAEILTTYDDQGLRGLLRAHAGEVHEVAIADDGIFEDLDTPDDFAKALQRRAQRCS